MTINEFIKNLKLDKYQIDEKDGKAIITLPNSDEYAKVYSILDKSDLVDLDQEDMQVNDSTLIMPYIADDFDVILTSDMNKDIYMVVIEEV